MQTIIALGIVGLAAGFLLFRFFRKDKHSCNCGCNHAPKPVKK